VTTGSPRAKRLFPRYKSAALAVLATLVAVAPALADVWYRPPAPRRLSLAWKGDPRAQAYLGYLYSQGKSVPRDYNRSAHWYRCAAIRGNPHGQFLIGLLYNKGLGVPQDYLLAYAWVDVATAHAPRGIRKDWVRVRDSIETKLSLVERTAAQTLAVTAPDEPACIGDPLLD
jgi:hypothetical protein